MRDEDDFTGAMFEEVLDGGQAGADAKIAGDGLSFAVVVGR